MLAREMGVACKIFTLFTEIAQYICQTTDDSEAQINFVSDIYFFPGHLDIKAVTHVKKINFLPILSEREGGRL